MTGTALVQVPFAAAEFADNPEQRCPCLLLLDKSVSMQGRAIRDLNHGLVAFKDELMTDPMAIKRVELATLSFGPVELVHDFVTADQFVPPYLEAEGDTPMGSVILQGLDMIKRRKDLYGVNAIPYYRPWVFLITDGGPTDDWTAAAKAVHAGEKAKNFQFFAVGVEGANMDVLAQISAREPMKLIDTRFRDLFKWLSNSLSGIAKSNPGEAVALENPKAAGGWAMVND